MTTGFVYYSSLPIDFQKYLPEETSAIVCSDNYQLLQLARDLYLPIQIIPVNLPRYRSRALFECYREIVDKSDFVIGIWDLVSPDIKLALQYATYIEKPLRVLHCKF